MISFSSVLFSICMYVSFHTLRTFANHSSFVL